MKKMKKLILLALFAANVAPVFGMDAYDNPQDPDDVFAQQFAAGRARRAELDVEAAVIDEAVARIMHSLRVARRTATGEGSHNLLGAIMGLEAIHQGGTFEDAVAILNTPGPGAAAAAGPAEDSGQEGVVVEGGSAKCFLAPVDGAAAAADTSAPVDLGPCPEDIDSDDEVGYSSSDDE